MKVGIFDSGVGGLTVYSVLAKSFPFCDFAYFADTAHLPYGDKSEKAIIRYSREVAGFLIEKKADLIVCACNTASSVAVPHLKRELPVPIFGVIDSAVDDAVKISDKIAVIGTKLTIKSGAYEREIKKRNRKARVFSKATSLLVPLIEDGWSQTKVCRDVLKIYLREIKKWKPGALILACTHYPVIKKEISRILDETVLVDSGSIVKTLKSQIPRKSRRGRSEFFVSDDPDNFRRIARKVMGMRIEKVKLCTKFL